MKKYVIKNCPAINDHLCKLETGLTHCADVSNCLFKQIADKCNKEISETKDRGIGNHFADGISLMAHSIKELLEIEESND